MKLGDKRRKKNDRKGVASESTKAKEREIEAIRDTNEGRKLKNRDDNKREKITREDGNKERREDDRRGN